jgi:Bax protein
MAQAIIESGWGSSKFAREGNNYFGVHCYTEGCGVKPSGNDSASFYVKTYPTEMAGIEDYLWILNTGHAYKELRRTRQSLREEGKAIDALAMAQGLESYSIKGEAYIKMVSNIIRNYIPQNTKTLLGMSKP